MSTGDIGPDFADVNDGGMYGGANVADENRISNAISLPFGSLASNISKSITRISDGLDQLTKAELELLDDEDIDLDDDEDDGFLQKIAGFEEQRLVHASKLVMDTENQSRRDSILQVVSPLHRALSVNKSNPEIMTQIQVSSASSASSASSLSITPSGSAREQLSHEESQEKLLFQDAELVQPLVSAFSGIAVRQPSQQIISMQTSPLSATPAATTEKYDASHAEATSGQEHILLSTVNESIGPIENLEQQQEEADKMEFALAIEAADVAISHLLAEHPHYSALPLHLRPPGQLSESPSSVSMPSSSITLSVVSENQSRPEAPGAREALGSPPRQKANSSLKEPVRPRKMVIDTATDLYFECLRNIDPDLRSHFILWSRLQSRQETIITALDSLPILATQIENHYKSLLQQREDILRFAVEVSPPSKIGLAVLRPESDLGRVASVPWRAFSHEIQLTTSDKKRWLHMLRDQEVKLKKSLNVIHEESEAIYQQIDLLTQEFTDKLSQGGYDAVLIEPLHTLRTSRQSMKNILHDNDKENVSEKKVKKNSKVQMSDIIDLLHHPREVLKRIYHQHHQEALGCSSSPKRAQSPSSTNLIAKKGTTNTKTSQKYRAMLKNSEANGIMTLRRSFGEWIRLRAAYEESRRVKKSSLELLERHLQARLLRMQKILSFVNLDAEKEENDKLSCDPNMDPDDDSELSGVEDKAMRKMNMEKKYQQHHRRRNKVSMKDPVSKINIRKIGKFVEEKMNRPKSPNAIAAKARGAVEESPMMRAEKVLTGVQKPKKHPAEIMSPLRLEELSKQRQYAPFIATEGQQDNELSPFKAKPFVMPPPYEEKTVLMHFPLYEAPGTEKIRENKEKLHSVTLHPSREELQRRHHLYQGIDLNAVQSGPIKMLTRDTNLARGSSPKKIDGGSMEEMIYEGKCRAQGKNSSHKKDKLSVSEIKAALRKGLSAKVLQEVVSKKSAPPTATDNSAQYKVPLTSHEQKVECVESTNNAGDESSLPQPNQIPDSLAMLDAEWAEYGQGQATDGAADSPLQPTNKVVHHRMFSDHVLDILAKSSTQPTRKAIALRKETIELYDFSQSKLRTIANLTEAVNDIKAYNQANFGSPEQRLRLQKKHFLSTRRRPHSANGATRHSKGNTNRWGGTYELSQLAESSDGDDDYHAEELDPALKEMKISRPHSAGAIIIAKNVSNHKSLNRAVSKSSMPPTTNLDDSVLSAFGLSDMAPECGNIDNSVSLEKEAENNEEANIPSMENKGNSNHASQDIITMQSKKSPSFQAGGINKGKNSKNIVPSGVKNSLLRQKLENSTTYKVRARMIADYQEEKRKSPRNSAGKGKKNTPFTRNAPSEIGNGVETSNDSDDTGELEDIIMGRAPGTSAGNSAAATPVPGGNAAEERKESKSSPSNEGVEIGEIPRVESTALLSYFAPSPEVAAAAISPSPAILKPSAVRTTVPKVTTDDTIQHPSKNDLKEIDDASYAVEGKQKRKLLDSFQPFHLNTLRRQIFSLFSDNRRDEVESEKVDDEEQKKILHAKQFAWNQSVRDISQLLSLPLDSAKESMKEEFQNLSLPEEEQAWCHNYFDIRSLLREFVVHRTRRLVEASPIMHLECDLELTELYLLQSVAKDLAFHQQRTREPETAQYSSHAFQATQTGQTFVPQQADEGVIFTPISQPIIPLSGPFQLPIDLVAGSVLHPPTRARHCHHDCGRQRSTSPSSTGSLAQYVTPHNQFKDFEGMLDRRYHRHIRALDGLLDGFRIASAPFRTGGGLGHDLRDRALLLSAGPEALLNHQLQHNQKLDRRQNQDYISSSYRKPELSQDTEKHRPLTNNPSAFALGLPSNCDEYVDGKNQNDIGYCERKQARSSKNRQSESPKGKVDVFSVHNHQPLEKDVRFSCQRDEEFNEYSMHTHSDRPLSLVKAYHLNQQVDFHTQNGQKLRRQVMHAILSGIEIRCVAALAPLLVIIILEIHQLAQDTNHEGGFDNWLKGVVLNPSYRDEVERQQGDQYHHHLPFQHLIESLLEEDEEQSFLAGCDWQELVFHKSQRQVQTVERWSATLSDAIEHNLDVARKASQSLFE